MLCSGILPTKFCGHRVFPSNLTPVDPRGPLHGLWPQQCTTLWSGVLFTKLTYDPSWGHFENTPTNLVGPSPTPMPTFSSIPQSMTNCIAGHTDRHTYRLYCFSSIEDIELNSIPFLIRKNKTLVFPFDINMLRRPSGSLQMGPDFFFYSPTILSTASNENCGSLVTDWLPVSSDCQVSQRAALAGRLVNFAWKVTPLYPF